MPKQQKIKSRLNPMYSCSIELLRGNLKWKTGLALMQSAKRCGAKTRQKGLCQSPAMKNGRCRLHGGKSPGAPCGEKHGRYSHGLHTLETKKRRLYVRSLIKAAKTLTNQI